MKLRVVKVGGSASADPVWIRAFAEAAAQSLGRLVIVHGGGPEITELSGRLGVPVVWREGLRVTTPEALDVASMVLSGRVNKRIVSALIGAGVDAVGLSGEDGGLVRAAVAAEGELGRVGVVTEVRVGLINALLSNHLTPVISPVSRGPDGQPLNVNADEVAAAVARALGAEELVCLTDVAAVLDNGVPRSELTGAEAAYLVASGVATGGMAVKLRAACAALEAGVPGVRIGGLEVLAEPHAGTRVAALREVVA